MLTIFKHIFCVLYIFYQHTLQIAKNTHYYVSVLLALLIFSNLYIIINGYSLFFLDKIVFDYRSPFFIAIGNGLVFIIILFTSYNKHYESLLEEFNRREAKEKVTLHKLSLVYVGISLLLLVLVKLNMQHL